MWAGPGDPFVVVGGHVVSPEDGFGEIGRMANGNLRRHFRISVGAGGINSVGPITGPFDVSPDLNITEFGAAPTLNLRRANGTEAVPTAVLNGEVLGDFNFIGHDGVAFVNGPRIRAVAAENWAAGAHGAGLDLLSVPVGSAVVTNRWQVQAAGHFVAAADNLFDVGQPGALRPRDIHVARDIFLGRDLTMLGTALIGTATAATGNPRLDVVGTSPATAAIVLSNNITNATDKLGIFAVRHRTNAEEPVLGMVAFGEALNLLRIGGGSPAFNAMEQIEFFTAANNTTLSGTLAADITGVGATSLFHTRGNLRIGALSGTNVSVGANGSGGVGFKLLRVPN